MYTLLSPGVPRQTRTPKFWKPQNKEQGELFERFKDDIRSALVSYKDGVAIGTVLNFLEETLGEPIPYQAMGFRSIGEFFFHLDDVFELRVYHPRICSSNRKFLFVKESALDENIEHVRALVSRQMDSKRPGMAPKANYRNTLPVPSEELLGFHMYIPRPPLQQQTYGNCMGVQQTQNRFSGSQIFPLPVIQRPLFHNNYTPLRPLFPNNSIRPRAPFTFNSAPRIAVPFNSFQRTPLPFAKPTSVFGKPPGPQVVGSWPDLPEIERRPTSFNIEPLSLGSKSYRMSKALENVLADDDEDWEDDDIDFGIDYVSPAFTEPVFKEKKVAPATPASVFAKPTNIKAKDEDDFSFGLPQCTPSSATSSAPIKSVAAITVPKDASIMKNNNGTISGKINHEFMNSIRLQTALYKLENDKENQVNFITQREADFTKLVNKFEPNQIQNEGEDQVDDGEYSAPPSGQQYCDPNEDIEFQEFKNQFQVRTLKITQFNSALDFLVVNVDPDIKARIDKLTREMTGWYSTMKNSIDKVAKPVDKGLYSGYCEESKKWYRVQLDKSEGLKDGKWIVLLCDHGKLKRMSVDNLRYLKKKYCGVPRQAFFAEADFTKTDSPKYKEREESEKELAKLEGQESLFEIQQIETTKSIVPLLTVKYMWPLN